MDIIQSFPTLYSKGKNGQQKIWSIHIQSDNYKIFSVIKYGFIDGKQQIINKEYITGKNIGKKNETTPLQQCINESTRKWKDKKEKEGYSENILNDQDDVTKIYPMLAKTFDFQKNNKIISPCFVQPKLDGLRCIIYFKNNKVYYQSRTGSYFLTLEYMTSSFIEIFKNFPNIIFDGELFTKEIPFEELAGIIKRKNVNDFNYQIHYHIYDIIDQNKTFQERFNIINHIKNLFNKIQYIEFVETILLNNKDECYNMFSNYIKDGYEGIIFRSIHALYMQNYRSDDLQKYKEFKEDEFVIIGYKEGNGRDKGTVIWICETLDKKPFSVRPRGTLEYRKNLFQNAKNYIGKNITIIYQQLSEYGIPRFPIGKCIRENF